MSGGRLETGRRASPEPVPPASPSHSGKGSGKLPDRAAVDAALLAAHAAADQPGLVRLYSRAADLAEAAGEVDAACFYLTHAYVFALATGAAEADALHDRLKAYGREE